MSLRIVIVNYRTAALVLECLRSLAPQVGAGDVSVTVVDNASGDGSAETLARMIEVEGWSGWVRLLAAPVNGGFAYGNNLAVRAALKEAVSPSAFWLLNPDTRVRPDALSSLLDFAARHPRVGIIGTGIDEADGRPWPYAFRFPSALGELDSALRFGLASRWLGRWAVLREMPAEPARADWVSGASMLVRREVFETIGLMDEGYFLYFEETDFCLQAHAAGWECWYLPQARIVHLAGQSTGVTGRQTAPRRRPAYWFESRRRYFVKNHGRGYAIAADLLWLLAYPTWRLRCWLTRRVHDEPPGLYADFARHSALFNAGLPVSRAAGALLTATPGH